MVKDSKSKEILDENTKKLIDHVEVEVEASLGESHLKISELQALKEGSIISINRQINESIDLKVNGKVIGRGEIIALEDKFAIRMTVVGD